MPAHYRLPSTVYFIVNTFALALGSWGLSFITSSPLPEQLAEGGPWQFLTNLSLALSLIAIISNYVVILFKPTALTLKLNATLNASSLVLETLVALIYWTLKIFFMALIVPENVTKDKFIPIQVDLTIHLFPVFYLSTDYCFNRTDAFRLPLLFVISMVGTLTGAYWLILEALVKPPAHYPYPFLNVEESERMKIFVAVGLLALAFYHIYEYIHAVVERVLYSTDKAKSD
ncbi:uncharacterized protein CYBJADRAFT_166419 [Cyberlindnera jadinii NRRL Y-1542]|uniref:FAR-17a/AIG1-like protein n=1 Tax=Cyberlindnera jadinii (strain ATCC 18201 / CBS 1600 / BCRC 20928 / JCM 3617 / NBRC 0987 / NRRL Y-1542) TaxID=983966 RepID=A0A1E4S586_CYBJN|nr:hypothetical protein CYBJADRAFT_166419 [Cyberlindnera jadinii NRRL Y-1542]ODV74620.1 hypothetical protein CYBJADRAFT_166419 [Cyberlindnera jadinii NRRL Y-1542]